MAVCFGLFALFGVPAQDEDLFRAPLVPCWEYRVSGIDAGSIVGTESAVFLSTHIGTIQALDAKDGAQLWSTEVGGKIVSNLVRFGEQIAMVSAPISAESGPGNAVLRVISKSTGLTTSAIDLPISARFYLKRADSGLIVASESGFMASVILPQGKVSWNIQLPGEIEIAPSVGKGKAVVKSGNTIYAISTPDGSFAHKIDAEHSVRVVAVTETGSIVTGNARGEVSVFDSGLTRPSWTFRTGGAIGSLETFDSTIYATSLDNFVYLLSASRGSVVWRRRTAGRPVAEPLIHNGFFASSALGESFVEISSTSNGKLINRLELGEETEALSSPVFIENRGFVIAIPGAVRLFGTADCQK